MYKKVITFSIILEAILLLILLIKFIYLLLGVGSLAIGYLCHPPADISTPHGCVAQSEYAKEQFIENIPLYLFYVNSAFLGYALARKVLIKRGKLSARS